MCMCFRKKINEKIHTGTVQGIYVVILRLMGRIDHGRNVEEFVRSTLGPEAQADDRY